MPNIRLPHISIPSLPQEAAVETHINLSILKPLLQVVIDSFVGDLADQREIRYTDLLLLDDFVVGAFDGTLTTSSTGRLRILFAARPLGDSLYIHE